MIILLLDENTREGIIKVVEVVVAAVDVDLAGEVEEAEEANMELEVDRVAVEDLSLEVEEAVVAMQQQHHTHRRIQTNQSPKINAVH